MLEVRENISEFAAFLENFVTALEKNSLSLANRGSVTLSLDLINVASTPDSQGRRYRYFGVVDEGRDEVSAKRSEFLIFADKQGRQIEKPSVSPARSYEIKTRSNARVENDFPNLISVGYKAYVVGGEKALKIGRRSRPQQTLVSTDSSIEDTSGLSAASTHARRIARAAEGRFNSTKIVKSSLDRATKGSQPIAGVPDLKSQKFDGFEQVLRASNVGVLAGIVLDAAEAGVEVFRENTPSRKETGNFKLISKGGPPVILDPTTGGSLKKGYVLVATDDLEEFIK
jgi:hypothetical protein